MGFFDFLEEQDVPLDAQGENPPVGKKQATPHRVLADEESKTAKKEQEAIRLAHQILKVTTTPGTAGGFRNELVQVRDALDKGTLKPHQLVSDLEQITKKRYKPEEMSPSNFQGLVSALNDLKSSVEQRGSQATKLKELGQGPVIAPEVLQGQSQELLDQAKKTREDTSTMGVLGKSEKLLEAKGLENQAASLTRGLETPQENPNPDLGATTPPPPTEEQPLQTGSGAVAGAAAGIDKPISHYMKGLGIDYEALTNKLYNGLKAVGIPRDQWEDKVDPRAGLLRVLSELDKGGVFAQSLAAQLSKAKMDDAAESGGDKGMGRIQAQEMATTRSQINTREQRMRMLYANLRESEFMHTWPGIILYVLVGIITQNPAFAAKLIGGVDANDRMRVGNEIKGIQFEINRLDRDLERQQREARYVRQESVRRLQHERDRQEDYGRDIQKMFINHQLILQRAKSHAPQEFKQHVSKIEGDYNRVMRQMSEAEKIMNNNWLDDDDPKKVKASTEYDQLKKEAMFLDKKLRSMTEELIPGTYTEAQK